MNKPECKTNSYGTKRWFLNGSLHREDGPAIEYADGDKSWFLNNKLHRKDGPASEFANASCIGKVVEIDGRKYKLTPV